MKLKKTYTKWLTKSYQLVIRKEDDLEEKSTLRFSYGKLISLLTLIFISLFALSLLLANTILSKWLNPAYLEQKNAHQLSHLAAAIKNLETQTAQQAKFINLLQNIIAGKEEPSYPLEVIEFTEMETESPKLQENIITYIHPEDAISEETDKTLSHEFAETKTNLATEAYPNSITKPLQDSFFFTPIEGIITTTFNAQMEHYGIDIVAKENAPIKCVADGMVIFATWTVETGWVIAVQHSRNLISIYKHNATLFKKAGEIVTAGEVIAIMGNSGELSTGPHLHFELWHEGNAVNPENFINF